MRRVKPRRRAIHRHNAAGRDMCWRLKQKYDRYLRTGATLGTCQEMGDPDASCLLYGDSSVKVGRLGMNRACTHCGRFWIS